MNNAMSDRYRRAFKSLCGTLFPGIAYASFNSFGNGPLCNNYDCALWIGGLAGLIGVPISIAILWALSLISRRGHTFKGARMWWIVVNGAVAYAVTVAVLLLGPGRNVTWVYVFAGYAIVFAIVTVLVDRKRSVENESS